MRIHKSSQSFSTCSYDCQEALPDPDASSLGWNQGAASFTHSREFSSEAGGSTACHLVKGQCALLKIHRYICVYHVSICACTYVWMCVHISLLLSCPVWKTDQDYSSILCYSKVIHKPMTFVSPGNY